MGAKRYIKNMILESIGPEGSHARDLVGPVSKLYGKPITIQQIANTLSSMVGGGEVRKEPEIEAGTTKRHRWFRILPMWT